VVLPVTAIKAAQKSTRDHHCASSVSNQTNHIIRNICPRNGRTRPAMSTPEQHSSILRFDHLSLFKETSKFAVHTSQTSPVSRDKLKAHSLNDLVDLILTRRNNIIIAILTVPDRNERANRRTSLSRQSHQQASTEVNAMCKNNLPEHSAHASSCPQTSSSYSPSPHHSHPHRTRSR
jgi:hypothetical protein